MSESKSCVQKPPTFKQNNPAIFPTTKSAKYLESFGSYGVCAAVGGAGKGSDEGGGLRELAAFEVPGVRCDNHQPTG